ncbi:hypothetical protein Ae201684P_006957 [Aphanomyces euteiches]|nr:hypothetical protein Ae201684P_006957 [Aphanomyces euteiches]
MDKARAVWKEIAAKAPNNEAQKAKAVAVVERQSFVEVNLTSAVACAKGPDQYVVPPTKLETLAKHGREAPAVELKTPLLVKGFNGPPTV